MVPVKEESFTFGLWIQHEPLVELKGEGIMTVLAELMKAAAARPNLRVVVAMAKWTERPCKQLLRNHHIPLERIEFLTSRQRVPILVRFRAYLHSRSKTPRRPSLLSRIFKALGNIPMMSFTFEKLWAAALGGFQKILATDNVVVAGAGLLTALLILLVCGPPLALMWVLYKLLLRNFLAVKIVNRLRNSYRSITKKLKAVRSWWVRWLAWAHRSVMDNEFRLLARVASARGDVPVWYVAHPAAVQAGDIGRPVVVAVPDVVYADFPTLFDAADMKETDRRIRDLTAKAAAVVSYCDAVREEHVVRFLERDPESAHVIPHAPMNLWPYLGTASAHRCSRTAAVSIIHNYFRQYHRPSSPFAELPRDYLNGFPFDEVDFLFASSQIRPHKNYLNLFRAFEKVLRRKHLNLKLFFTGRLQLDNPEAKRLRRFVRQARLHMDIISLPDLPTEVHAAFYRLAKLTVVPTFFEGGFPFPFSESLSVGTPVLMSSIPATRDVLPPDLAKAMLFDPHDVDAMAERIAWGATHRQELWAMQQPFHAQLRERTWNMVLDDYLDVFRKVAEKNRRESSPRLISLAA